MRSLLGLALALCVCLPLSAQQLEPNTPGGSAMINGFGPSGVGNPIQVGVIDGSMTLQIDGNAGAPYTMFFGQLGAASVPVGTQFVDLDLFAPFGTLVDGLNVGLAPGGLPNVFGFLPGTGSQRYSFPVTNNTVGLTMCFQGAVLDPSMPIGLNVTGAPELTVVPIPAVNTSITGDDYHQAFTLANPISLYGHVTQDITVSTNGFVVLSNLPTYSDLSESTADFLSGAVGFAPAGSAPVVAAIWEDVDMGNGNPGQQVDVVEVFPGIVQVSWVNGDYYPNTPFGTVVCTIDSISQSVILDYSGYNCLTPPIEGLIGVSDGGVTGAAVASEIDFATGGVVPGYGPSNPTESVFQNFDATGLFSETFDLAGLVLTFVDVSAGSGTFSVF